MIQLQQTFSDFNTYGNNRLQLHFIQNADVVHACELPYIHSSIFAARQLNYYKSIIVASPCCRYLSGFIK